MSGRQLLDLEEDVRHRRRFSHDEEPPLLEQETREPALEWPTVSDDRRSSRWML